MEVNLKKTGDSLSRAVYIILLVIPFSIGTVYSLVNFFGSWDALIDGHTKSFYYGIPEYTYKACAFLAFLAVAVIIGCIVKKSTHKYKLSVDKKTKVFVAVIIFLSCVAVRLILFLIYKGDVHPFSDFEISWTNANYGIEPGSWHSFFPAYVNFALFEKIISCLTGANYDAVLIFCILCNGITNVFIFLITNEIFNNYRLSLIAALLYLLNPSSIVYALISTPEHMTIACCTGAVYFICKFIDARKLSYKLLFIIAAGILGGVGSSVKTFFPVIVIAAALIFILEVLFKTTNRKKSIIILCVSVTALFMTQQTVVDAITAKT